MRDLPGAEVWLRTEQYRDLLWRYVKDCATLNKWESDKIIAEITRVTEWLNENRNKVSLYAEYSGELPNEKTKYITQKKVRKG